MKIVSDSGPILSFARAGRLQILRRVFHELIIPNAVYIEITTAGKGKPGAAEVESGGWIKPETVQDRAILPQMSRRLNLGEMEAVALAKEIQAALLIDEHEGRREAQRFGVPYFGSLRVLKEAKDLGFIPLIRPLLDDLIGSGTYISDSLYDDFLRASGEAVSSPVK